jgi:cell division protein FtsB
MREREQRATRARRGSTRSRARRRLVARFLPVVVLLIVAYLYYRPISSWLETKQALHHKQQQVEYLQRQKSSLERSVANATSLQSLVRHARRIGLVQPGEQLFIVKGVARWKRAHGQNAAGTR